MGKWHAYVTDRHGNIVDADKPRGPRVGLLTDLEARREQEDDNLRRLAANGHKRCPECQHREIAVPILPGMRPEDHPDMRKCSCGWEPSWVPALPRVTREKTKAELAGERAARRIQRMSDDEFDKYWEGRKDAAANRAEGPETHQDRLTAALKGRKVEDLSDQEFNEVWHKMR
jgi:hypothetical protein